MIYFTTATDLAARLSAAGVQLRIDDDASAIAQVQQQATNDVRFWLEEDYSYESLENDALSGGWTNDRATDLGAYYLCRRRGNRPPKTIQEDYMRALDWMEQVAEGKRRIPGNVPLRHSDAPTFSNLVVRPNYNLRKIRVERPISEGTPPKGYALHVDWPSEFLFEF